MSDSDEELDLVDLHTVSREIGDHELKNSPLVTKAATTISNSFPQRGLLGTLLSVYPNDFLENLSDPRIYLNLDTPSSGLVCGVQGSGKSHTVSCILESSLMASRKVGTLPAPLATIVFHLDEENGKRPCEAAYLSELKDGSSRGVEEVVVLVSPSSLKQREMVYSGLEFVEVKPLRIAEQDLNANRMLSMMGADDVEFMPLYMHTFLSILRDMGSDNFTYRDFRQRLKEPKFDLSQNAMLDMRLDLLDAFLQGDGPDVKSFFKPGRLVIIDISDPFVESATASMLFDICLGLFIEWKASSGKLIVLDEAHKYLTNSDANRFTKSICSIIRQQRHLAARVIVSTQEPTVVPASVLDLLSWIICHRFSSPGWVKHLKDHMCAEEGVINEISDWGKRVMTLRTGEALLYSPASLFATDKGKTDKLSTGYAIMKTRSRLTSDGGVSLLATDAHFQSAAEHQTSTSTPPVSDKQSLPDPSQNSTPSVLPNTPISKANPPIIPTSPPDEASPVDSSPDPFDFNQTILTSYNALIQTMKSLYEMGLPQPDINAISRELTKHKPPPYNGRLGKYLQQASADRVLTLSGEKSRFTATLHASILKHKLASSSAASLPSSSEQQSSTSMTASGGLAANLPPIMVAFLGVIAHLAIKSKAPVPICLLSPGLKAMRDGDFKAAGYKRLGSLAQAAHEQGLITIGGPVDGRTVQLNSMKL